MPRISVVLGALLLFSVQPAADADTEPQADATTQAIQVFSHCMQYAGDSAALRTWITGEHLKEAPQEIAAKYLMDGKRGRVFGGSSAVGALVIVSQDDGGCSLFTDRADSEKLFNGFEGWLRETKFTFSKSVVPAPQDKLSMESVDYEISGVGRHWRVVISTVPPGKSKIGAIMTAYGTPARTQ